ncbi:exocyst complex component Sec10-domain-containing protein [Collybia nuda]|uniref:Exocyst complex component Sec10-domain-containing protein n=1 Tax=Collybia nuda TaxID=64659 RepID=A0A9P6CDB3_9AGAR|nr:exocyst complex component Sec10-domain-containing protein [Collybia nuda]
MDKFAPLEPVRLYSRAFLAHKAPTDQVAPPPPMVGPILASAPIGRLQAHIHVRIVQYLPLPDVPSYARTCRAANLVIDNEDFWGWRCEELGLKLKGKSGDAKPEEMIDGGEGSQRFKQVLELLEDREQEILGKERAAGATVVEVEADDFGDFIEAGLSGQSIHPTVHDEMGDFFGGSSHDGGSTGFEIFSNSFPPKPHSLIHANPIPNKLTTTTKELYRRAHSVLRSLVVTALAPNIPPHQTLSVIETYAVPTAVSSPLSVASIGPSTQSSLLTQSTLLSLLDRFLSPELQPLRDWRALRYSLRTAMGRFDASLLAAFDSADERGNEESMREAAEASWEVWNTLEGRGRRVNTSDWEMGKVWAEKREIFYERGRWNPLDNITPKNALDFTAMDEFMGSILSALQEHGSRAVRIFPPASQVLLSFADRIASEIVGEYISTLLARAREPQMDEPHNKQEGRDVAGSHSLTFLKATAASFREAWRMVDIIMIAAAEREDSGVKKERAEDVIYQMFGSNMDEYLNDEVEHVREVLEAICKDWDRQAFNSIMVNNSDLPVRTQPRFLSLQNPNQMKRNVLTSFTSMLLLPVTIVPRMGRGVGGALMTGGNAAVQGIAMLNPQRWGAGGYSLENGGSGAISSTTYGKPALDATAENNDDMVFESGDADDYNKNNQDREENAGIQDDEDPWAETVVHIPNITSSNATTTKPSEKMSLQTAPSESPTETKNKFELLLSLDVALEVIHADRESLKRVETFLGYPGYYGHRVRDTIEEVFILMLQALTDGHLSNGFRQATEQMRAYKPAEHTEITSVAPLLQFLELVHIGDTIQSMVQVYFDKEMIHHIDKNDFMNAVIREKKRFENALDDSVAAGLNAGTEVLMNQVEHIILSLTEPQEYSPPGDGPFDFGPTKGCTESIKCLDVHCRLLKGSMSKEVLEVFYQEIGIRLIAILQKHIKRQKISLFGGFQVIADLNAYHAFISSLKVPKITSDFSHLKMLGHVFVIEDAKDLAQIARDVTHYGGAYRPEDIYEFIQRRSDWKKIEKIVDKTMYNLSFKEDCIVC